MKFIAYLARRAKQTTTRLVSLGNMAEKDNIVREKAKGGRTMERLITVIVESIMRGEWEVDTLAPSVRRLACDFGVSTKTAHRALEKMAAQGILRAEPRRGYRIIKKPTLSCKQAQTLAFVVEPHAGPEQGDDFHRLLAGFLQSAALARRWPMLSIRKEASISEMVTVLQTNRVFGAVLDLAQPNTLVRALRKANIPSVLIDCGTESTEADILIQDGQAGGKLAVEHLVQRGCRRIAWVGNTRASAHSMDRLSGALLGLYCANLGGFEPDMMVDLDPLYPNRMPEEELVKKQMLSLFTGRERPDGILALWTPYTHWVQKVAMEMGLRVGSDFHLVGWSVEEMYESVYASGFGNADPAPAVVWKAETMIETAVARLAERRISSNLPTLKIKIPVQLRIPTSQTSH